MADNDAKLLSSKIFNIFKDTDRTKSPEIQALSDNLANIIIDITTNLNPETAKAYNGPILKIVQEVAKL